MEKSELKLNLDNDKMLTKLEIGLLILVCILITIIALICETDYEFCWTNKDNVCICSHQKIGDYLLGKN